MPKVTILSGQVLNELAQTLLKPRFGLHLDDVREARCGFKHCPILTMDLSLPLRAIDVCERHGRWYCDGLIVATAERGQCAELLSEDVSMVSLTSVSKPAIPFIPLCRKSDVHHC